MPCAGLLRCGRTIRSMRLALFAKRSKESRRARFRRCAEDVRSATALLSSFDGTNRRSVLRSRGLTEATASHSRLSPRFHSPSCSSSCWAGVPPCCGAGCLPPTGRLRQRPGTRRAHWSYWPLIWPCHPKSRFGAVRMARNVIPSVPAALLIVSMAMNCGLISRALSFYRSFARRAWDILGRRQAPLRQRVTRRRVRGLPGFLSSQSGGEFGCSNQSCYVRSWFSLTLS